MNGAVGRFFSFVLRLFQETKQPTRPLRGLNQQPQRSVVPNAIARNMAQVGTILEMILRTLTLYGSYDTYTSCGVLIFYLVRS